ncbi:LytR family transcriptional regulator [Streptococcus phocae subsp. salmonis]|uniref:hypothetical protein n=1 Tax=Streptococcus phocae TaxID=119224 RepID=UPI0005314584|nr:hypothetical protein [Streptococcus phocae]KGR73410.1 LytR family transcriptional regulator [Streptococcus phocae subsp. salmonis]
MPSIEKTIDILLDVYAYNHAYKISKDLPDFPPKALYLIEALKERRELNVTFLFERQEQSRSIEEEYQVNLLLNEVKADEQIANYLLDLEVKVKNGEIIDFVRSVSPLLYRLFLRLIKGQITSFETYVHDSKNDRYDTWNFPAMTQANNPIFNAYLSKRQSRYVTTGSLAELLVLSDLPQEIKDLVVSLRQFEKSVRNPLAHLIKPFDEEELHRTTHFSSQAFLESLISLATYSGVAYSREPFYFDQINTIIEHQMSLVKTTKNME